MSRIPLPHTGTLSAFLCAASPNFGLPKQKEVFYVRTSLFRRLLAGRVPEVRDLRKLLFSALMIALCIVLAQVPSVPLFGGAKVTWGFLARSVCAWVCGPVLGLLFAFAEDILSFFLTGGGGYPFFPGYTLTTMLGVLTYALFLYRAPLRVWRIFCAKLVTNVQNVVLGALWIAILNSNGRFSLEAWYASASLSAVKNLIMLPVQTVLLVLLLRALQPALQRTGMLPRQGAGARPD